MLYCIKRKSYTPHICVYVSYVYMHMYVYMCAYVYIYMLTHVLRYTWLCE